MQPNDMSNMMSQMMNTQVLNGMLSKPDTSYLHMFGIMILMQLIQIWPQIKNFILLILTSYWNKYKKKAEDKLLIPMKHQILNDDDKSSRLLKSSICYCKKGRGPVDVTVDAIVYYISNNNQALRLLYQQSYIVSNVEEFIINDDIYCKTTISELSGSDGGSGSGSGGNDNIEYKINLYSYTIELNKLKEFVESIKDEYAIEQSNKLGSHRYYFNQRVIEIPKTMDGRRYADAIPNMIFSIHKFVTNKSLSNAFGDHLQIVKKRIDTFINNPEWYSEKGIPYTLGIMLSGPPGTGKTSLIKAIANDTNRHIINIDLNEETTQTQLTNIFLNDTITVNNKQQNETYTIPISKRIYVIEDIDARCDVVKKRTKLENDYDYDDDDDNDDENDNDNDDNGGNSKNALPTIGTYLTSSNYSNFSSHLPNTQNNIITSSNTKSASNKSKTDPEKITLGFLLNLLDGILETPGRILIITSNHPEQLDPALIRPGRIDVNLQVGWCTPKMFREMYNFFYKTDESFDNVEFKNNITPARFSQLLQNNFNSAEDAYKQICKEMVVVSDCNK